MSDLSAEAIGAALTTRRLGHPVLFFESTSSTNDIVRARAAAGAAEGLLAVAEEQTAGRGRQGRSWWAPPGTSLLMSLLLRPPLPPTQAAQTTMCLGLGAVEGIARVTGLRASLKWPNDVVLNSRKLAGMLTEMDAMGDRLNWVALGLGINVNLPPADANQAQGRPAGEQGTFAPMPADVAAIAISLAEAVGRPVDRLALLAAILEATEAWYERLLRGEPPHEAWAARLDTLGRMVRVTLPGDVLLEGVAEGVNAQGALLVRPPGREVQTVWAGDVTMVRPIE